MKSANELSCPYDRRFSPVSVARNNKEYLYSAKKIHSSLCFPGIFMYKKNSMIGKCPGKVSRKSRNCRLLKKRTIRSKIPGGETNGTKIPRANLQKYRYISTVCPACPVFLKFRDILFYSPLETKQSFWSNGKLPMINRIFETFCSVSSSSPQF